MSFFPEYKKDQSKISIERLIESFSDIFYSQML